VDNIRCIALSALPGGGPVAITQRDNEMYVYLSEQFDHATIAEALTLAIRQVRAEVTLR
jgi:hypothetical protein